MHAQANEHNPRFGLNWAKLRAWQWEDWDALIMLDADMVVLGDLTHLFALPTDFAWAPLQGHSGWHWNRCRPLTPRLPFAQPMLSNVA